LKPREIVRGRRGALLDRDRGMAFCHRADGANTTLRTPLIPGANIPGAGLNIQGIEYTQVFDRTGVDRPNGA